MCSLVKRGGGGGGGLVGMMKEGGGVVCCYDDWAVILFKINSSLCSNLNKCKSNVGRLQEDEND